MGKRILAVANCRIVIRSKLIGNIHALLYIRARIFPQVLNHLENFFCLIVFEIDRTVLYCLTILKNLCVICAGYHLITEKAVVCVIHGIQLNAICLLSRDWVSACQLFRQSQHIAPSPGSVRHFHAVIIKNLLIQIGNLRLKRIRNSGCGCNAQIVDISGSPRFRCINFIPEFRILCQKTVQRLHQSRESGAM